MIFLLFLIFYFVDITYENWPLLEKNNTNPPLFIFTFTSWCPHCHGLINPFQKLQRMYEKSDKIIAATLNCTLQMGLCSEFQIKSFPSFIFYYKSKIMFFLNPERNEKGLEYVAGKIINYYDHDTKLIERLYINNHIDANIPRFVCKIDSNETNDYSDALKVINESKLIIDETFFFDPTNQDLRNGNCEVYFSETQIKIMDPKIMCLSEFISENKIGYFSKTWNFDQISTLKKFFVLVLPNNQESISKNITNEFDEYFSYGSIDPLGIDQIKNIFDINFDIESENQSCLIIIRIKCRNKKKIRYHIIHNPDKDKIKLFLNQATVKGQMQWKKVNDNYARKLLSDIDNVNEKVKGINIYLNDKYKTVILGAGILMIAFIIFGYFIIHIVQKRINNKDE